MSALWFIAGFFIGSILTVFTMCLAFAAKQTDRAMGIED